LETNVPDPGPEREPSPAQVAAAYTGEIPLGQPEPVHYDPDLLSRLSPCGLNLDEVPAAEKSTNPALVTCALCAPTLVDGQLAEPALTPYEQWVADRDKAGQMTADEADAYYTALERQRAAEQPADETVIAPAEPAQDRDPETVRQCVRQFMPEHEGHTDGVMWNCTIMPPCPRPDHPHIAAKGAECFEEPDEPERRDINAALEPVGLELDFANAVYIEPSDADTQPLPAPQPERRTVGLEVLTPELRAVYCAEPIPAEAKVGVVLREHGAAVLIADTELPWTSRDYGGVRTLRGLLTEMISGQSRLEREDGRPVELLMPTPDVLAALAGQPVGGYPAAVSMRYNVVRPGWWVLTEKPGDDTWELVDDRQPCTTPGCDVDACQVVTVRGRGQLHMVGWYPVLARIPADQPAPGVAK
jgi:hypothetical protein